MKSSGVVVDDLHLHLHPTCHVIDLHRASTYLDATEIAIVSSPLHSISPSTESRKIRYVTSYHK
jgi:hypothetical protein